MTYTKEEAFVCHLGNDLLRAAAATDCDGATLAAAAELALSGADSSDPARARLRHVALLGYLATFAAEAIAHTNTTVTAMTGRMDTADQSTSATAR